MSEHCPAAIALALTAVMFMSYRAAVLEVTLVAPLVTRPTFNQEGISFPSLVFQPVD